MSVDVSAMGEDVEAPAAQDVRYNACIDEDTIVGSQPNSRRSHRFIGPASFLRYCIATLWLGYLCSVISQLSDPNYEFLPPACLLIFLVFYAKSRSLFSVQSDSPHTISGGFEGGISWSQIMVKWQTNEAK